MKPYKLSGPVIADILNFTKGWGELEVHVVGMCVDPNDTEGRTAADGVGAEPEEYDVIVVGREGKPGFDHPSNLDVHAVVHAEPDHAEAYQIAEQVVRLLGLSEDDLIDR